MKVEMKKYVNIVKHLLILGFHDSMTSHNCRYVQQFRSLWWWGPLRCTTRTTTQTKSFSSTWVLEWRGWLSSWNFDITLMEGVRAGLFSSKRRREVWDFQFFFLSDFMVISCAKSKLPYVHFSCFEIFAFKDLILSHLIKNALSPFSLFWDYYGGPLV